MTCQTPMGQLMEFLPSAKRALFAKYHLGGCSSCAFSNDESLADLCQRSQLDADEVLAHLIASHHHDEALWMTPERAHELQTELRWIDTRTREEHEAVVIAGSDFLTNELQQQIFASSKKTMILLYDHSGKTVLDQVAWFRGHGLENTFGLRGGIDAWSREIDHTLPRYRLEIDAQ